jgi:hypothetical protein
MNARGRTPPATSALLDARRASVLHAVDDKGRSRPHGFTEQRPDAQVAARCSRSAEIIDRRGHWTAGDYGLKWPKTRPIPQSRNLPRPHSPSRWRRGGGKKSRTSGPSRSRARRPRGTPSPRDVARAFGPARAAAAFRRKSASGDFAAQRDRWRKRKVLPKGGSCMRTSRGESSGAVRSGLLLRVRRGDRGGIDTATPALSARGDVPRCPRARGRATFAAGGTGGVRAEEPSGTRT